MARGRRIVYEVVPLPALSPDPKDSKTVKALWRWAEQNFQAWQSMRDALDDGHPVPHSATHMLPPGVVDSVSGEGDPSEILLGADGALGDPTLGYAPLDHIHSTAHLLGDLEDLLDLESGPDGVPVSDSKLRRLLERLLLELMGLVADIEALLEANVSNTEVLDAVTIPVTTTSANYVELLPADPARRGAAIYNDSANNLLIRYGGVPTTADYGFKVFAGQTHQVPKEYSGPVNGILDAGFGSSRITKYRRT